jgi:hypothetical protein
MTEYKESDFMSQEDGIKYVFNMFSIIYGSKITTHWGGMNVQNVMDVWKGMIGNYLTYRPTLDFAIQNLDSKGFVTNPMAFKELCSQAGRIPIKPERTITHQKTQKEIDEAIKAKEEALVKIKKWTMKLTSINVQ